MLYPIPETKEPGMPSPTPATKHLGPPAITCPNMGTKMIFFLSTPEDIVLNSHYWAHRRLYFFLLFTNIFRIFHHAHHLGNNKTNAKLKNHTEGTRPCGALFLGHRAIFHYWHRRVLLLWRFLCSLWLFWSSEVSCFPRNEAQVGSHLWTEAGPILTHRGCCQLYRGLLCSLFRTLF